MILLRGSHPPPQTKSALHPERDERGREKVREFRFILGRRALIVFLALLIATGALLGMPATTRTLAESSPPDNQSASTASSAASAEALILDPAGRHTLLQASSEGVWTETNTPNPTNTPSARYDHAMAATPSGALLFGGYDGSEHLDDTWLFAYDNITKTGTWTETNTAKDPTTTPSARWRHAMASTPSGALLFGGIVGLNQCNDTWLFDTATNSWTNKTADSPDITNTPSPRAFLAMATLPDNNVLLFGGMNGTAHTNDTWLFDTATNSWTQLSTSPTPSARSSHAMASTPSGVLLFGGIVTSSPTNDTWLFTYDIITKTGTWTETNTSKDPTNTPSARVNHAMAFTPSGVLLFGGLDSSGRLNDTWLFTFDNTTGTGTWTKLQDAGTETATHPSARFLHTMASTPSEALLFGGYDGSNRFKDTWLFTPGESTSEPTISVISPAGGVTWAIGSQQTITWTSTKLTGTCTVELSRNGVEGPWTETLTTNTATKATLTWTVTGPASANCLIRVTSDTVTGTSGQFTIAAAPAPAGMPGLSPWALALLSLFLLGAGGWWFSRRRRLA